MESCVTVGGCLWLLFAGHSVCWKAQADVADRLATPAHGRVQVSRWRCAEQRLSNVYVCGPSPAREGCCGPCLSKTVLQRVQVDVNRLAVIGCVC